MGGALRLIVPLLLLAAVAVRPGDACQAPCGPNAPCGTGAACSGGCCTACSTLIPNCQQCSPTSASIACTECARGWYGAECSRSSSVAELLVNGGFENGDLSGWTQQPDPLTYIQFAVTQNLRIRHSGSYSLLTRSNGAMEYISQTAATVPGTTHRLSLWLLFDYIPRTATTFLIQLQPAPADQTAVLPAPAGDGKAPSLQPGSSPGSYSIAPAEAFNWTRYQIEFIASAASTTIWLGFQHPSHYFYLDDVSLQTETDGSPVIQSAWGSTTAATLSVYIASPQPGASYYLRAFKDAGGTQPDGGAVPISDASHAGTFADPFTFTWSYTAPVATQRWFVVEADADGSGPGQRVASSLVGAVPVGGTVPNCEQWIYEGSDIACAMCSLGWQGKYCNSSSRVERLVNGGFEDTALYKAWSQDSGMLFTFITPANLGYFPRSGAHHLISGGYAQLKYVWQTIATGPGQTHRLSFWLRVYANRSPGATHQLAVQVQPASEASAVEPQGQAGAPQLQRATTPGSFTLTTAADIETWTLYQIDFTAFTSSTTIRLGFQGTETKTTQLGELGSTAYYLDDVSVTSADVPVVQSVLGSKQAANLTVYLASPQHGATYYIRAFKDAAGTQPDGGAVPVSDASHRGTAADPFTFTWRYTSPSNLAIQRWCVVEADPDGSGPGQRVTSSLVGPVLLGVPAPPMLLTLTNTATTTISALFYRNKGTTSYVASLYRIEAQRWGNGTWQEVTSVRAADTLVITLPSKGRWNFRAAAGNANGWGEPSDSEGYYTVGLPAVPDAFKVTSPAANVLRVAFNVTAEHFELGTRFYVRGVGENWRIVEPASVGSFMVDFTVPVSSYSVFVEAKNNNVGYRDTPPSTAVRTITVAKLQSPTIVSIMGSGSGGPTLTFQRPANAGTARLAWSFTLLSSNGTQVGNASTPNSAASITGNGLAASPHKAVLALPDDVLRSGGLFRLRLTATYLSATLIEGDVKDSSTTQASPEFGLGKPLAPTIASIAGGEKTMTVVLSMPRTVRVGSFSTQAIRPTKFVLGLLSLLAGNKARSVELDVPAGDGPYNLTYQPTAALPRDEWIVTVAARHSNGDSAAAQWKTAIATGLPAAVTLGKVTAGPSNATIRFTHKPWYSQGLQVRVRVWNPIGADGKLLAAGKEVEETLPAPKNATAGVIPAGAGNLARVTGVTNAYEVVVRIGSTAAKPIPRPGRWRLSVALRNAVGFGPDSGKSSVVEVGLPLRVGAPSITAGQGQVAVRINRTRTEWPTATNPPTVHNYTVRLEQIVSSKAQLIATATVAAANAGRDVVFGGLQAGRYRAVVTPCGVNGCAGQASPASPSASQPCNAPAGCDRTQKDACSSCELCKAGFILDKTQCTACTGGQRAAVCASYSSPGTSCQCKTCANGWRLEKNTCVQCPAITNCEAYSQTDCKCKRCRQHFIPAANGQSCTCTLSKTVTAALCAQKNSDQCSCRACQRGHFSDGAGGCKACPSISNCSTFTPTGCSCEACKPGYAGSGATCSLCPTIPNCETYSQTDCKCTQCKQYFRPAGDGRSCACPAIPNCDAYSQTDCKCTQCKQFFRPAADGRSCACSLSQTVTAASCAQKNSDQCSCMACHRGYISDGAGGCRCIAPQPEPDTNGCYEPRKDGCGCDFCRIGRELDADTGECVCDFTYGPCD